MSQTLTAVRTAPPPPRRSLRPSFSPILPLASAATSSRYEPPPLPFQVELRLVSLRGQGGGGCCRCSCDYDEATVGLGWPWDGCGDISAGNKNAGWSQAWRPRGAAAGTPLPWTSLRDGRRQERRGISPAMPSKMERGLFAASVGRPREMSSQARPPGGKREQGASPRTRPREAPLWT